MKHLRIAALIMAGLAAPVWAQHGPPVDWPAVEIETTQLSDGVYMLFGRGGNVGLSVGSDGAFVIDSDFKQLSEKVMAAIAAITDADVKFLVSTHYHPDHVGGNEAFAEAGVLIIAHDNVRARMSEEMPRAIFHRVDPAYPVGALPIVTFSDDMTFHWNGDTIRAIHVGPAHTDGDIILHFRNANVIYTADIFMNGMYPYVDNSGGGDIDGMIAAGYRVLSIANADTVIVPGHGPLSDAAGLAAWLKMVKATRINMQSLIDQGLSEDEAVAARPTAEFDEQYGGRMIAPEMYSRLLYRNLTRN